MVTPHEDEHHFHHHHEGHHHHEFPNPADRHVTILLSEVKYDIKFDTWLREKVTNREMHNRDKESEKVGYAYSDDKAQDWLGRQIGTAIDRVKGELAWCVVDEDRNVTDEMLHVPSSWCLHLHFSPTWRGSLNSLRTAIHKYVCEYVLAQWYRAAMPQGAERYDLEADKWLEKAYQEARSEVVVYKPWTL